MIHNLTCVFGRFGSILTADALRWIHALLVRKRVGFTDKIEAWKDDDLEWLS